MFSKKLIGFATVVLFATSSFGAAVLSLEQTLVRVNELVLNQTAAAGVTVPPGLLNGFTVKNSYYGSDAGTKAALAAAIGNLLKVSDKSAFLAKAAALEMVLNGKFNSLGKLEIKSGKVVSDGGDPMAVFMLAFATGEITETATAKAFVEDCSTALMAGTSIEDVIAKHAKRLNKTTEEFVSAVVKACQIAVAT